jgi:FAD/FMN-containing dehydrogenase
MEVDRRTVLRWAGVGALTLAGCGKPKPRVLPPVTTTTAGGAPGPTTSTVPGPVPWPQLARQLTGRLVRPSDAAYGFAHQLYDPRFDAIHPAAIAYCASPTDVQRALAFAREHDVPIAARSGGHSYGGYSTSTGLVIDVTTLSNVGVNGGTATVGAGTRLIDLYTALNGQGVSIPAGSCPTVGIAGLAFGGGIGVVARQHGLTTDAINSVQIVTADSRIVTADASRNADLFWAMRGAGGGNFGIATSIGFNTFPVSDVALFTLHWGWLAAGDVVSAWMPWIQNAPDALSTNCILELPHPAGPPLLQVAGIWLGSESDLNAMLDSLVRAVGVQPSTRFTETKPLAHINYVEAGCESLSQSQCHLIGQTSQGQLQRFPTFAHSSYINGPLDTAGVNAVVAGINERVQANQPGAIAFDAYGGAINRVAPDATAFVHRNALCCAQYSVTYEPTDSASTVAAHKAWLTAYHASLAPHVTQFSYQNYIDPTLKNSGDAYYGANLPRLRTVKKKYDPDNAFQFAQSITPA